MDPAYKAQTVTLPDGTTVPRIGQGTWKMAENPAKRAQEIASLRLGIEMGMTLLDTAEMYADGGSETLLGEAIRGIDRDSLFIVSKVYPHNAGRAHIFKSCESSLKRMGIDTIDLYLLHWRGGVPLQETVECMEKLIAQGKVRRFGVSNLDTDDMHELWQTKGGQACTVNQVLYHLGSRGIEFDLLPWMRKNSMPCMAYCPIAMGGRLKQSLFSHPTVLNIAKTHGAAPAQVLLAFAVRTGDVIAIPKAGTTAHAEENAKAAHITLSKEDLSALNTAFPPPTRKQHLDMQ
jgi:diketogulonate reductase-like aldo/keto reductase